MGHRRLHRIALVALASLASLAFVAVGCGWHGRGRALVRGRPPFDLVDPSGTWIAEGNLPWGTGHVLQVGGPGPVYRVTRLDPSGQPLAFGVGIAEAGHFFVGYTGALEASQVAVYGVGEENVEGVWADGRGTELGTEEWHGVGMPDPFAGAFPTWGTNPGGGSYHMTVTTTDVGSGVYDVRWGSGTQEFLGVGFRVGDRFATAAVLTYQASWAHSMWSQRGYALGIYDLTNGTGVGVFRATAESVAVLGTEQIRRP